MRIRVILIILYFFIFISLSYGQESKLTNEIDSLGLKQGEWIELEAKPDIIGVTHIDLENGGSVDRMRYNFNNYLVLKYVGIYKDGLRDGEWKVYSLDEKIRYLINYKDGVIFGNCIKYHANGKIHLIGFIDRKSLTKVSYYDKVGQFIKDADWYTSGFVERLNR